MTTHRVRIAAVFTWIGFVCAISFMEAWLKFTAPGVTLSTGLAIGQVVFNMLNKVELILALVVVGSLVFGSANVLAESLVAVVLIVLLIQTFFVLPELSKRVGIYLDGGTLKPSSLHTIYVAMEVIKVITLLFYGFKQLNNYELSIINTR